MKLLIATGHDWGCFLVRANESGRLREDCCRLEKSDAVWSTNKRSNWGVWYV